jgi:SAM-dependent methyltransferase
VELEAGTGKLTEQLVAQGHRVTALDPSEPMLRQLASHVTSARPVLAPAESLPLATRSVDVVVVGQAFHRLEQARVLTEIARVLRPGGVLALAWNQPDERIPWVRRLETLIGDPQMLDPTQAIDGTGLFQTVESARFRFWQPLTRESLQELAGSRSKLAVMSSAERAQVLGRVDQLYDDYGRGHDGMLLPYLTHGYRAVVLPWAVSEDPAVQPAPAHQHRDDTNALLIDFR